MTPPLAVIDVGSMSTRLLLADPDGPGERHQILTRLGHDLRPGGPLSAAGLHRVRDALVQHRRRIDDAGVTEIAVVATAAARQAANTADLLDLISDVVGVDAIVLSGQEEGRLAFAGATADLDHAGPVLVLDIGGGSTEFSVGRAGDTPTVTWSADIGAGSVTDAYLHGDPPTPWELAAALSVVELHVDDVVREVEGLGDVLRDGITVGVGGTISTVAAVELGLLEYDADRIHRLVLSKDAIEDVFRTLATERAADRAHNPGLPPDRVDVIVGGCCVLVEVLRRLGIDELLVSERDLLDGVAAERLAAR